MKPPTNLILLLLSLYIFPAHLHGSDIHAVYSNLHDTPKFIVSDVDNDGDLDIIADALVYYQNDNGAFDGPYTFIPPNNQILSILGAGIRNAGEVNKIFGLRIDRQDPVATYDLIYFPHTEYGEISNPTLLETIGNRLWSYHTHDLDKDTYIDYIQVTVDEASSYHLSISWGNNSNTVNSITTFPENERLPTDIEFIDINHDGMLDIVYEGVLNGTNGLCAILQLPNRTFSNPQHILFSDNSEIPNSNWKFSDLNGDDQIDLYQIIKINSDYQLIYSLYTSTGFAQPISQSHPESLKSIVGIDSSSGKDAIVYYFQDTLDNEPIALHSFIYNDTSNIQKTIIINQPSTTPPSTK